MKSRLLKPLLNRRANEDLEGIKDSSVVGKFSVREIAKWAFYIAGIAALTAVITKGTGFLNTAKTYFGS